jgi:hypothetical protein
MNKDINENASIKAEVERLEHQVNYWRIEAETDNARWLRCLEDKERLTKAGDAMAKHYFDLYWSINAQSTSRYEPSSITNWKKAKE